jgi:signal transduction histidine kinase
VDTTEELVKPSSNVTPVRSNRLQAVLKNVTKEMYKRNYELAQTNRTLTLLRQVDSIALGSHESLNIFLVKLSEAIVKTAEFPFVGVFTQPLNHHSLTNYYGAAGTSKIGETEEAIISYLHINDSAHWYKSEEDTTLIDPKDLFHNGLTLLPAIHEHSVMIHQLLETRLGVKSLALIKLTSRQKVVGVMIVGFQQTKETVDKNDIVLIQRLGESIGVAVDSKLLFEENKRVVNQLQKANDKLKALDEAKDDFISMASHQLRTPLTSVKGYLSMVMEEDAGSVTKLQKEMLGQAFFSSQRMVYLIADLLNVSRLKTGKFLIEPAPVNLAEVVEQELGQLQETAESRSLKLSYTKPKSFPTLMLDETKTRQVIMNFTDNAIYYTPAGGEIIVRLIDKPETIELRVEDNGIGVPKSEQHHLFTKFYRAGNARKARPDGTGLGLYMAKKVIAAEGGSIIFESKEGKGSTFGFIFSKARLSTKDKTASVSTTSKP